MRKKFIFAAALCLTTLSPVYNVNAAVQVTQEIQQDGQTIRGKVIDNTGEPVIGANVTIKGTTNGVITDIDGNFVLNNAKGTLVISFVGYKTQEIPIAGKTTINVQLQEDSELLDEVVVTGYGAQKKASLTSAISQIKGDEAFANKSGTFKADKIVSTMPAKRTVPRLSNGGQTAGNPRRSRRFEIQFQLPSALSNVSKDKAAFDFRLHRYQQGRQIPRLLKA